MSEVVSSIAVTVGANVTQFVRDMNTASSSVEGLGKKARAAMSQLAAYGAAATAAGIAVGAALYVNASEEIDRQAKLARAVGGTTASIQSLERAAGLAGVNAEALASANEKLNAKLGQAVTVGGAAAEQLDRMGLSAKALANMDADERLAAIADRIVKLGYNSAQSGAALKELGIKGSEMNAMMMDGGDQFRAVNAELKEFGFLVSDVDAAKIEAANDAWDSMGLGIQAIGNTLAVELSPYVEVLATYFKNAAGESAGFKEQIKSAVEKGIKGFAKFSDVIQGLRVVFKGVQLVVVGFGAAVMSVIEGYATASAKLTDFIFAGLNKVIEASNKLLGTNQKLLEMPSESGFMQGLHEMGDAARNEVTVLREELAAMAMQEMPSAAVEKYLNDVKTKSTEAAQVVVNARKAMGKGGMPEETEEETKTKAKKTKDDADKKEKSDGIMENLRAGTAAMQTELAKRAEITGIYRANQLAADAPYYAQQLNDIKTTELVKQAELMATAKTDAAQRAELQAQNLERVAGDKTAMAAIVAEYDAQELLAEQLKQSGITAAQEEAQLARERLRKAEMDNAISVALGLGQQLMSLAQGHSKKAFEFAKKAALGSAVIDGYKSATAAWSAGMATGGPWAPFVAAGYTAASLLKTGSLISSIRGTSFGSSGGGGGSGGGATAPAAVPAAAQAGGGTSGGGGSYRFEGLSAGSLVSSDSVVAMLKQAQKDGALRGQLEFA